MKREDAQNEKKGENATTARNGETGRNSESERFAVEPGRFRVVSASETFSVGSEKDSARFERSAASAPSVKTTEKRETARIARTAGDAGVARAAGVAGDAGDAGTARIVEKGGTAEVAGTGVGAEDVLNGALNSLNSASSVRATDLDGGSAAFDCDSDDEFDDENAFFASFSNVGATRRGAETFDDAFAGGLRSIFDAESEDDEDGAETSEDGDASEAERFQRDFERERRESLDGVLLQNDADFLREAGEKYERSRVSDADFERRNVSRSGASGASNGQNGRIGQGEQNRKGGQNGVIGEKGEDVGSANVGEFGETSVEATGGRRVPIGPASILEAMLFVGDRENRPLTLARATELMRNVSETEAIEALADLNERYWRDGAPYRIVRDGDGFRMALRPEFDALAARMVGGKTKEFKLTQTMIDVLALIAYRQPISLDEILETRNNATGALAQLVKRELVAQEKRVVDKKKVAFYSTTPRFLRLFNLESLDDLPIVGDVDYR